MTLTLTLQPELEQRLIEAARNEGLDAVTFAERILDRGLPHFESEGPWGSRVVSFLSNEGVLGIWADRKDLPDSPEYARQLREAASQRSLG